jgi:hypothetical protein
MKKAFLHVALAALVLAMVLFAQDFAYIGVKKCEICHKSEAQGRQYPIWEGSLHAKSFEALTSPMAAEAALGMGTAKPAEDPVCLKCHAPFADSASELKTEGVSCEVCHGPGSAYRKLGIMKDRALAAQNGLILYQNSEAIKAKCMTCHDDPHGITFDFAAAWEKIKHFVPNK